MYMFSNKVVIYTILLLSVKRRRPNETYKKHIKKLTADRALLDSLNDINQILQEEYDKMKVDLEVCKQLYQNQ